MFFGKENQPNEYVDFSSLVMKLENDQGSNEEHKTSFVV